MATFDIRNNNIKEITEIIFANEKGADGYEQANKITKEILNNDPYICIVDGYAERIAINSVEHAQYLIKALNKAIELGWLK